MFTIPNFAGARLVVAVQLLPPRAAFVIDKLGAAVVPPKAIVLFVLLIASHFV